MVESKPEGAAIFVNGEKQGVTPDRIKIDFSVDPTERTILQLVKDRYRPIFQSWTVQEVPDEKLFTLEVD